MSFSAEAFKVSSLISTAGLSAFGELNAKTPPAMNGWAFNYTPNNKTLYVPKGTVSKYQNANPWYNFYNICEMPAEREEQALEEIHFEGAQPTKVLHNGQLYILRGGNAYTPAGQIVK